jgi:hypothetical protein
MKFLVAQFPEFFIMFLYCLTYNRDKFFTVRLCLDFYYMVCTSFIKKDLKNWHFNNHRLVSEFRLYYGRNLCYVRSW